MTKRGLTIAENFAAGAKTSLLTNDELTLSVLVNDAMKDPDVAYVIVVGSRTATCSPTPTLGAVEARAWPGPGLGAAQGPGRWSRPTRRRRARIIDFAVPLVFSDVPVGALYLGFSQAGDHRRARPGPQPAPC